MSRARLPFGLLAAMVTLVPASSANSWQPLTNQPPFNPCTMFLLMDGRVLVNEFYSANCWLLTPDATGSYLNGTWTQAATMTDDRLGYASGILRDGRLIVAGGENSGSGGQDKVEIYDPVKDQWASLAAPTGWTYIGDAPSVVLSDGRFMIGCPDNTRTAIYDPVADTWVPSARGNDPTKNAEQTWTLLPDGTVLAAECYGAPASDLYDPFHNVWVALGNTPANLVKDFEIGPAMVLYTGEAFQLGARPRSARYIPAATPGGVGTWVDGGLPPLEGGKRLNASDTSASILPNGHVLCAMGDDMTAGTYFCEYTGTAFVRVIDPANSGGVPAFARMLPLPTGEVLFASSSIYLYTCDGGPDPAWLPTITSMATDLIPGQDYLLQGTQLNGLTTANSFGDDAAAATNYPLVRLTFPATGDVVYCRCHDASTLAIATGSAVVSTQVEVKPGCELGQARLEVVANGLASAPMDVVVRSPITIDFDALATGVVVDAQYAQASFSAPAGFANWTVAMAGGTSAPNVICTGTSAGAIDGSHDTDVDFRGPVASLTFSGVGVDATGTAALVNVFEGGVLTATVPVEGLGTPTIPVAVDLTAYHAVTRIEITAINDAGGIAWDDFRFCLASTASAKSYGSGFPGTLGTPGLTAGAPPLLGASFKVDVGNSLGSATTGLLCVGLSPASIPTSAGGTLLVSPFLFDVLPIGAAGDSFGTTLPADPALCGFKICMQVVELDPGAAHHLSFTAGLELVLGN